MTQGMLLAESGRCGHIWKERDRKMTLFSNTTPCTYAMAPAHVAQYKREKVIVMLGISGIILNERRKDTPKALSYANVTFGTEVARVLFALSKDPANIEAIVVETHSPGGAVTGSQDLCYGFLACRHAGIPVFCYVPEWSASGSVMATAGATCIIMHPNALVGSIGVRGQQVVCYEHVTQLGDRNETVQAKRISSRVLYSGEHKVHDNPFAPEDVEYTKATQAHLDKQYEKFIQHVSQLRGIDPDLLRQKGAMMFDADEAVELGLVNLIGKKEPALNFILEKIESKKRWADYRKVYMCESMRNTTPISTVSAEALNEMILNELRTQTMLAISPGWLKGF